MVGVCQSVCVSVCLAHCLEDTFTVIGDNVMKLCIPMQSNTDKCSAQK